jgi:hypothetical protein
MIAVCVEGATWKIEEQEGIEREEGEGGGNFFALA